MQKYNFQKNNTTLTQKLKRTINHTKHRLSLFSNNTREVDLRKLPQGILIEQ